MPLPSWRKNKVLINYEEQQGRAVFAALSFFSNGASIASSPTKMNVAEAKIPDSRAWTQLQIKVQQEKACRAFGLFRDAGIEPVLIKGLAAAIYYPDDVLREAVDIDLAVAATDFDPSRALIESAAFQGLAVDLHREVRHLDTVSWDNLFQRSRTIETPFGQIRVLAPEDHLRILCVHWLNDGGTRRDRLWDIYYAIANRDDDFNWSLFLDSVSPKRRRWIVSTIGLAHRYLGLPIDLLPIADEAADVPAWLIKSVERTWREQPREIPLWLTVRQPRLLAEQMARRFSVNPVRATIELEGSFDGDFRLGYQFLNFFQRLLPSMSRNIRGLAR